MSKKESKADSKEPKRRHGKAIFVLIIVSIIMIAVFRLGYIFFLMAMLPSVVAFYIDITPARSTFHTVFACNLSGVLPYLGRMMTSTSDNAISLIMTDTMNWLIVYTAAGVGWLLVFAGPMAAQFFIQSMHQRHVSRLQSMQERILAEWGQEVEEASKPNMPQTSR